MSRIIFHEEDGERWVHIRGYECRYMISDRGRVFSIYADSVMKLMVFNEYNRIDLRISGSRKMWRIGRLVGLHFVDGFQKGLEIDHIDRNSLNDNYTNLRWVTKSGNQRNKSNASSLGLYIYHSNTGYRCQIRLSDGLIYKGPTRSTILEAKIDRDQKMKEYRMEEITDS